MSQHQEPIPLQDLKAQYSTIRPEIEYAIARVLAAQEFILGSEVATFESELGAYLGNVRVVGVGSGSDALLLALMALDVKAGDQVILPAYTFFATAGAVVRLGAQPIFLDVCRQSLCLDVTLLADFFAGTHPVLNNRARFAHAPEKTRVVLPVHLFGLSADLESLGNLARSRGCDVVEDAAQALGATTKDRPVGTVGKVNCLSFFPSKNLGAAGDGGAVVTRDEAIAERLRSLRAHGGRPKYHHREVGINSRLDALQAAILRVKLRYLDAWNRQRSHAAARYDVLFEQAGLTDRVTLPWRRPGDRHVFHQYVIRLAERDRVLAALSDQRIGCAVYYPIPMHLQPCFTNLGYQRGDCPVSEAAAQTSLALPIYPEITEEQQARVVAAIRRCLA